jgi:hypothetical protein
MNQIHVCHLTSVHPRFDARIFLKECRSLSHKYRVSLVVADGKGDETKEGVDIYDVGVSAYGRLGRMTLTTRRILKKAKELNAELYHFHDPELIPIGLKLKKWGKKVIFDSHEPYSLAIRETPHYYRGFRRCLSDAKQRGPRVLPVGFYN